MPLKESIIDSRVLFHHKIIYPHLFSWKHYFEEVLVYPICNNFSTAINCFTLEAC